LNSHPGLTRQDVMKYGPAKMLLMAASEFWRAGDLATHPEKVKGCLSRAQELLGLVETVELPEDAARMLQPYMARCRNEILLRIAQEPPDAIREICQDYAERFELMAQAMKEVPHA
jgi:hypothetical protein